MKAVDVGELMTVQPYPLPCPNRNGASVSANLESRGGAARVFRST